MARIGRLWGRPAACSGLWLPLLLLAGAGPTCAVAQGTPYAVAQGPPERLSELQSQLVAQIEQASRAVVVIARLPDTVPLTGPPIAGPAPIAAASSPWRSAVQEVACGIVIAAPSREQPAGDAMTYQVLTNAHLLADRCQYVIWLGGKAQHPVQVVAADPWSDLAVLAFTVPTANGPSPQAAERPQATEGTILPWGHAELLQPGELVLALGNPWGMLPDDLIVAGEAAGDLPRPSAALGMVSKLQHAAPAPAAGWGRSPADAASALLLPQSTHEPLATLHQQGTLIETDIRVGHVGSGGALVDLQGELVGLITAMPRTRRWPMGGVLAIPTDAMFRRIVDDLRQGREVEYGYLGVELQSSGVVPEVLKVDRGAGLVVRQLVAGGAADRSGLRAGDQLLRVDGQPLRVAGDLLRSLAQFRPGDVVRMAVQRYDSVLMDQRELEFEVRLDKWPAPRGVAPRFSQPLPLWRGMAVEYTSTLPVEAWPQASSLPRGVAVRQVVADSVAWRAGLRPGMVIARVDDKVVSDPPEFWRLIPRAAQTVAVDVIAPVADAGRLTVPPENP